MGYDHPMRGAKKKARREQLAAGVGVSRIAAVH